MKKKKILLISDNFAHSFSGVAIVAKETILNTLHHYDWVNLGCKPHDDKKGYISDLSKDVGDKLDIKDSYIKLYHYDTYGNPVVLREVIESESPDAIMLITDPHYFKYVFNMRNEFREIPLIYLNIWDDGGVPPLYNRSYYESCDLLLSISQTTKQINRDVLSNARVPFIDLDKPFSLSNVDNGFYDRNPIILKYVPHGLDENIYKPLEHNNEDLIEFKNKLFPNKKPKFTLLFDSKNIQRKNIPSLMEAWKCFMDKLPKEEAKGCYFILKTNPKDKSGTDLNSVKELFGNKYNFILNTNMYSFEDMNKLYNISDGNILVSNAEGWGLSLTCSALSGTPNIIGMCGGMQDQAKGEWAYKVYPITRKLIGSQGTPYIYDNHYKVEDISDQIYKLYKTPPSIRKKQGQLGRDYYLNKGLTGKQMGNKIIDSIDYMFSIWEPSKRYVILNTNKNFNPKTLKNE